MEDKSGYIPRYCLKIIYIYISLINPIIFYSWNLYYQNLQSYLVSPPLRRLFIRSKEPNFRILGVNRFITHKVSLCRTTSKNQLQRLRLDLINNQQET